MSACLLALILASANGGVSFAQDAPPPPTDATRAAQEVFQDPDFWWKRTERIDAALPWYETILKAIWEFIRDIFLKILEWIWALIARALLLASGDWSAGTPLVWLLACLCLGWAAWKLYPLLREWLGNAATLNRGAQPLDVQQLPEAGLLYQQALQAMREGRLSEALRLAILASIARLQHEGLLRYDPARTNREYQSDLRSRPELATVFGEVARPFERAWYGRIPPTSAEAARVVESCRKVVEAGEFPSG